MAVYYVELLIYTVPRYVEVHWSTYYSIHRVQSFSLMQDSGWLTNDEKPVCALTARLTRT